MRSLLAEFRTTFRTQAHARKCAKFTALLKYANDLKGVKRFAARVSLLEQVLDYIGEDLLDCSSMQTLATLNWSFSYPNLIVPLNELFTANSQMQTGALTQVFALQPAITQAYRQYFITPDNTLIDWKKTYRSFYQQLCIFVTHLQGFTEDEDKPDTSQIRRTDPVLSAYLQACLELAEHKLLLQS